MYLVALRKTLAPAQATTQTLWRRWPMVASVVIGQLFGGSVFSETTRRVMYFSTSFFFLFTHIDMELLLR